MISCLLVLDGFSSVTSSPLAHQVPHLPQEVPMLPEVFPKTRPCTAFRVWSIVCSMAILSHNSAAFKRGQTSLGWLLISREYCNARCSPDSPSRASEQHPPWLSPNPATRAPFSDWLKGWSVVFPPENVSATCPSLAPPSKPADWLAACDVTRLRVSGN